MAFVSLLSVGTLQQLLGSQSYGGCQFLFWVLAISLLAACWLLASSVLSGKSGCYPPAVPGVPVLGNLLQLREKKPHKTFTAWAEKYGPIYTIRTGVDTMVVISSPQLAKEAMITKFTSISTRKLSTMFTILSAQKTMVATADYGEEHSMLKKLMVANLLGPMPQRANRHLRERASYQMIDKMFDEFSESKGVFNVRDYCKQALFPFAIFQVLGRDPDAVFVEGLGRNVSRWEMFQALVLDPMQAAIKVDWREFFPAFKWVPSKVENRVVAVHRKIRAIIAALISEQRKLLADGKKPDCYLDILLTQATHLTENQLLMSTWEPIVESTDTTMIAIEWAMYELAKNPVVQERLYKEIIEVAGSRIVVEDDLPKLKLLEAIVKETLRKYPPLSLLPPRYVDTDMKLGGFDIKKGWQVIINAYGINYNKETWSKPEVWNPDRILGDESLDLGFKDHRIFPFGAGKRLCAGITQAMLILPMNVAYFVQHFEWRPLPEDGNSASIDTVFLTTHKLHPLKAMASRRCPSRLPAPAQ